MLIRAASSVLSYCLYVSTSFLMKFLAIFMMISCILLLVTQLEFIATRGTSFTGDIAIDTITFGASCCAGKKHG